MQLREYLYTELVLSRRIVTRLKKLPHGIKLNGEHVTVRAELHIGDRLELALEDGGEDENPNVVPSAEALERIRMRIIYEDGDIIAVNKPAAMPTHPSHGHFEDSLANALAEHYRINGEPFVFRAVNRLDRDTSGIVLVAKNQLAAKLLSEQLQRGEVRKAYIALLCGELEPEMSAKGLTSYGDGYELITRFRRQRESIITREVAFDTDGIENCTAHTRFRVLARSGGMTEVLAEPVTGRTHQLRVHFAYLGHPIVGDELYGADDGTHEKPISRQALHAYRLSFSHPTTGEPLELIAPLSDDIGSLLGQTETGSQP